VNVEESSMAIEADGYMLTRAGTEIGVASTKAFTAQLVALASLSITFARETGIMDDATHGELVHALGTASAITEEALALDARTQQVAKTIYQASDMLFIGRGTSYAIACEGALKMKEISYIHAEAYAAGELKHGPLALIDENVPVVAIAPHDELFDKTASNVQEVAARGGRIIVLSDAKGVEAMRDIAEATITLPDCHPLIAPIIYTIPLQLLSYHTAVLKGTDVDQPRNLAKSVTVE
jgi:glucosamine--fructose-6-phosphate aminotransferase (isomerizing)